MSATRPALVAPLLVLCGAAVSLWFADRGAPNPDEGAVLTAAARILRGAVFYRDLDAYWMPGAAYLLALFEAAFGEHLAVARALAAALFCTTLLALYACALALLDRTRAALFALSLLAFKFLAWPAFTAYLYSDFSFCAACVAMALLLHGNGEWSRRRLALCGAALGLAFFSKQNVGIYAGAAAAVLVALPAPGSTRARPGRRVGGDLLALAGGAALLLLPALGYFARAGVLPGLLHSALVRPVTSYLHTSSIPFSGPLRWWEWGAVRGNDAIPYLPHRLWHMLMQGQLPGWDHYAAYWNAAELLSRGVYTAAPLVLAAGLVRGWRARRDGSGRLFAFALLALAVFLTALPRADWFHVASVLPPVLLLLFALARRRRPPWLAAALVLALLAGAGALTAQYDAYLTQRLELPRARLWVAPEDAWIAPAVRAIESEVPPDEPFFVLGHEAQYYFLTGRFPPWPFSQLYPGQLGGDGGLLLAERLRQEPPRIVFRGLQRWTAVPPLATHAPALMEHMASHYEVDDAFFAEHRPEVGEPPPSWVAAVLRPRNRR